jgi:4a-hydroxytetrahydrobiopterin dehydratase
MTDRLSDAQVRSALDQLKGWHLQNGEIVGNFELPTFPAALLFVSAVGHLAEAAGHHPDITIKYRNVTLALTTHDAKGLTNKDFALAQQINQLVNRA